MRIRFIEYGKVFLTSGGGALDYSELDRSDNEIISNTKNFYLKEVATFIVNKNENLLIKDGMVSVAFFPWDNVHYLFMQVERKRENWFIDTQNFTPNTQRSFNQARFVFINKKDIKPNKFGITSSLVYENPAYSGGKRLPNYVDPDRGRIKAIAIEEKAVPHCTNSLTRKFLEKIIDALYSESRPRSRNVNSTAESRTPKSLFIETDISLEEKIRFFDEIQYWLYPALGLITFASDYITDRHVNLFLSNGHFPEGQIEKERILDEGMLHEKNFVDYFDSVCGLPENDLYHNTLEYYLRLDIHPNTAVNLFRLIESDFEFQKAEIEDIVTANAERITDEHFVKIFKKRLLNNNNVLVYLIMHVPISKRLILLRLLKDFNYPSLLDIRFAHAAFNNLSLVNKDVTVIKSLLAKELDYEKEKLAGQIIEWDFDEIRIRINRLLLAESQQEVMDETNKIISCEIIPSGEMIEKINTIVSEHPGYVLKFTYDISGELKIVLSKSDSVEKMNFYPQRISEDVELLKPQTITCAKCASLRSANIVLPCPECGARKTIFGYQYDHTYRSMRLIVVIFLFIFLTILFIILLFLKRHFNFF